MLLNQTSLSKNEAKKLLIKHNGDITECVLETYNYVKPKEETNDNDEVTNKLLEFRRILDERKILYFVKY